MISYEDKGSEGRIRDRCDWRECGGIKECRGIVDIPAGQLKGRAHPLILTCQIGIGFSDGLIIPSLFLNKGY